MIGLDVSTFPPEIGRILLLRGSMPGVSWKDTGQRGAKRLLDELEDHTLLGVEMPADASMASAVRALLYLWSGWIDDCKMCSQAAPPAERLYLASLCLRHSQRYDESKAVLKTMGLHPVYRSLAEAALPLLAGTAEPSVQRLREMLSLDGSWEPYLFCDLVAQGAQGKLKTNGEAIVRQLQCRELELLLIHYWEAAAGQKLSQRKRDPDPGESQKRAQERERRLREDRRRREVQARPKAGGDAEPARRAADSNAPSNVQLIGVVCPKCRASRQVPASIRGQIMRCNACSTPFEVPAAGTGSTSREKPRAVAPATVMVICPKCAGRTTMPASACGKTVSCGQCGAKFIVPQPTSAAAPR